MSEVMMPALSPTMEEGKLAKWLVKEGDVVEAGDVIAEIETDKAVMELEAVESGEVRALLVEEGAAGIAVRTPIAIIGEGGEVGEVVPQKSETVAEAPKAKPVAVAAAVEKQVSPRKREGVAAAVEGEVITVRQALRDAMAEEMRRDEKVIVMGEEVAEYEGAYKVTQGLLAEFGSQRVIDTPITEYGFAGVGVGAAFGGMKPIVEFMTFNFAMQAIDHIVNSAAKTLYMSGGALGCPIVFRGPNGAAARVAAQHSQDYAAWYAHVPGLKVVVPFDAADAKGLLKAAIRDPNPVVFLEHELLYGHKSSVAEGEAGLLEIGKAALMREGDACTLISYGHGLTLALEAAEVLAQEGIGCDVINLRTLRPLDTASILGSVEHTNRLVVVEECWPVCGIGAEICAYVGEHAFDDLDAPPTRVSGKDVPMPYAENLEKLALPSVDEVVAAVRGVCA